MQSVRHTFKHTVKLHQLLLHRIKCMCVFVCLNSILYDVSLLGFTDSFVCWCFWNDTSVTQLHRWEKTYWCIYKRFFFLTMKIFGRVLKFFFSFFFPSLFYPFLLSTQQQSREWLSHPCKGVCAWVYVCVTVCVCVCERERVRERERERERDQPSTLSLIQLEDLVWVRLRSGMEAAVSNWRNKPNSGPF